jgi:hypothetical protein
VTDLTRELIDATLSINVLHLQRLHGLGVSRLTAANLECRGQARWGVVRARAGEDGLFLLGEGDLHLVLPVEMDGALMVEADWLRRDGQRQGQTPGRNSADYVVNPAALEEA